MGRRTFIGWLGSASGRQGTSTKSNAKDETDRLLVKDEEIKGRWREYFNKLFNGENEGPTLELDDSFDDTNRHFVRRIQETEIGEALKRMNGGKAIGPDGIC